LPTASCDHGLRSNGSPPAQRRAVADWAAAHAKAGVVRRHRAGAAATDCLDRSGRARVWPARSSLAAKWQAAHRSRSASLPILIPQIRTKRLCRPGTAAGALLADLEANDIIGRNSRGYLFRLTAGRRGVRALFRFICLEPVPRRCSKTDELKSNPRCLAELTGIFEAGRVSGALICYRLDLDMAARPAQLARAPRIWRRGPRPGRAERAPVRPVCAIGPKDAGRQRQWSARLQPAAAADRRQRPRAARLELARVAPHQTNLLAVKGAHRRSLATRTGRRA
jgi:hypothetical protein